MDRETKRIWIVQWALIGAGLLALAVSAIGEARAHAWYSGKRNPVSGFGCCGGTDCAAIPRESAVPIDGGYQITLRPGDHPMVTKVHVFTVPTKEVQDSQDGDFHVCLYPDEDHLRCFFVPPTGA